MFLFAATKIGNVTFPNRIWVTPMCQYSAHDGFINEWHEGHLMSLINGRPGLLIVEATAVIASGRISTGCTGLWRDDQAEKFQKIINYSHSQGTPIGIQLNHAGRKGSTLRPWEINPIADSTNGGWEIVAPSSISFHDLLTPRPLSKLEINEIVDHFGTAAMRAVNIGFDVIEIHAAYGYLIHQFLSPISNLRQDEYGGNFQGRTLFLCEIVRKIRNLIPRSMPLFVRIPAHDWVEYGWSLEEALQLSTILKNIGVDLIDIVSGGITENAWGSVSSESNVELSQIIRREIGIPTASGGQIEDPHSAERYLEDEYMDYVLVGKAVLRNPHWPLLAAEEFGVTDSWPKPYERGRK
jgi:2,4-dienoyl-CoA reductase-like NADH-dependent reductase (Old Yellow Enzyme family)